MGAGKIWGCILIFKIFSSDNLLGQTSSRGEPYLCVESIRKKDWVLLLGRKTEFNFKYSNLKFL